MKRLLRVASASIALLVSLPSIALAGWHFSRHFSVSAGHGTATGHTCQSSKFSDWSWNGTVHSHGNTVHISWLEPIRRDGHKHAIIYTSVSSPQWAGYPANLRTQLENTVLTAAQHQHPKVRWVKSGGTQYLDYFLNGHLTQVIAWHPHRGC